MLTHHITAERLWFIGGKSPCELYTSVGCFISIPHLGRMFLQDVDMYRDMIIVSRAKPEFWKTKSFIKTAFQWLVIKYIRYMRHTPSFERAFDTKEGTIWYYEVLHPCRYWWSWYNHYWGYYGRQR